MVFQRFKQIWDEIFKDYTPPSNPIMRDSCSKATQDFLISIAEAETPAEMKDIIERQREKIYIAPQHPEDRIAREREFIKRLSDVQTSALERLVVNLGLNEQGADFLFDYIFNCDDPDVDFANYLASLGRKYEEFVQ